MLWSNLIYLHLYSASPVLLSTINTLDYKPNFNHTVKQHFIHFKHFIYLISMALDCRKKRKYPKDTSVNKTPARIQAMALLFLDNLSI